MVMQNQAELLKIKFGKAIAEEASPNEIVSIPGLRNRAPKEISIKNLAYIIESRMVEIIEMVQAEIIASGYYKKLAGGIVITGGGSQLQYVKQLFEYMTGLDARIGHPNEHLGRTKVDAVKSPMYATSVGLVLAGFKALDERENQYRSKLKDVKDAKPETKEEKSSGAFLSKFIQKTKTFLTDDYNDSDY